MTRVRITGLEGLDRRVKLKISQAIAKGDFKKQLQEEVVLETIRNGIEPNLADSTIKRRERLATVNTTGNGYQANKSNLTFTGQLLRSLRIKYIASKLVFQFTALKTRKPYNLIRGGKSQRSDNRDIFRGQAELYGRSFANLFKRKAFVEKITKLLKSTIRANFKS